MFILFHKKKTKMWRRSACTAPIRKSCFIQKNWSSEIGIIDHSDSLVHGSDCVGIFLDS